MHEFEHERQRAQQGFRACGLHPVPPPRPPLRASVRAYTPAALLFLLGASIAGIVIALTSTYEALLFPSLGDMGIGVVWLAVIPVGVLVVLKTQARRRRKHTRSTPPARVHETSLSRYATRDRSPDALPPYPPELFFSYEPLNERFPEHLNPDQRNRF